MEAVYILSSFLFPLSILIAIIYLISLAIRHHNHGSSNLQNSIFFSVEDASSQGFLLVALTLFGVLLFALNQKYVHSRLDWEPILLIIGILAFTLSYYTKSLYLSLLGIFATYWWWIAQSIKLVNSTQPGFFLLASAFFALSYLLLGGSINRLAAYRRFGSMFIGLGTIFLIILLFFISMNFSVDSLMYQQQAIKSQDYILLLIPTLFLAGSFYLTWRQRSLRPLEYVLLGCVVLVFLGVFLYTLTVPNAYGGNYQAISPLSLFGTTATIGLCVAFMINAYHRHQVALINLLAFTLFIFIIMKYIDWFNRTLDTALFFISAGLLFFLLGWGMERGRRYLLKQMKEQP